MSAKTPKFLSSFDECTFIGTEHNHDFYFIKDNHNPVPLRASIVAVFSDNQEDYISGMSFVFIVPILNIGLRLAFEKNLIDEKTIKGPLLYASNRYELEKSQVDNEFKQYGIEMFSYSELKGSRK